jgi:integrase
VDGTWHRAPTTFRTKREADAYLASVRVDMERGTWIDPDAGKVTFAAYADRWLSERPELRPRTRELYEGQLRLHINPVLGDRAEMIAAGRPGPSTIAKCYRLVHAVFATAVEDGAVPRNPCVVKGASAEKPAERPVATIEQVFELADAIEPQFRAAVLLATFCGLRLGEIRALRVRHVDLLHRTVRVVEQYQELVDGTLVLGPPKTDAGVRTVSIPAVIVPDLEGHLAAIGPAPDALLFTTTSGAPLRRGTLYTAWGRACRRVGIDGLRFHDLRHTGNTLAAATGASTKELMSRMGHASSRAALIYQHATRDRDAAIADSLSTMVNDALQRKRSG